MEYNAISGSESATRFLHGLILQSSIKREFVSSLSVMCVVVDNIMWSGRAESCCFCDSWYHYFLKASILQGITGSACSAAGFSSHQ
jgi:hypothetical protein